MVQQRNQFVSFVQKHVTTPADAEDIVQSAFARALEKGDSVREESVIAWFYRVLRNAIIDHYRRRAANHRKLGQWAAEFREEVQPSPEMRQQVCQCILPVIETLKPEYRAALRLVDIEDRPLRELATLDNISENNASVRLHRARRALRRQVQVTCGACANHGCVDCNCGANPSPSPY